ncbi:MAG TPA: phytoene/squalene synthase family protein [Terriglobales bacterium]|jgi:phytoene synthase|nr:phytoene/squalene synthase family protein [Terriglobales bacterium]
MSSVAQRMSPPFSPTESQIEVAYSVCRGITRAAARNFYYAFLVLPKAKRQALSAIYAFMRRCDDIADDESLPVAERRQMLTAWLDGVHRAQAGNPTDDPVLLALTAAQRRFYIPDTLLDQLAFGTAMDLEDKADGAPQEQALRYRTFDDLYLYCYRVASVVGLVCIRIFGYQDPAAEPLAEKLGQAFQLTNIIRDIKEDAGVGRIYLPEEDFARFGISPYELHSPPNAARFAPLLEFEANRARDFYKAADALIPLIEEDSQPALWALVAIYRKLLEKIASRNYDVFHARISLSTGEKLAILGKGILKRLA